MLAGLPLLLDFFLDDDDDDYQEDSAFVLALILGVIKERRDSVPRTENYAETIVPLITDVNFRQHFRMTRGSFEALLREMCASNNGILPLAPSTTGGRPPVAPDKHLLVVLWVLGNQCCIRDVADRFGLSKSTVWILIRRVCRILVDHLAPLFIKWPCGQRVQTVTSGFQDTAGLPGCLGAIDGSHIEIKPPADDMDSFRNRLYYHSIVLQAVCDSQMLFTTVLLDTQDQFMMLVSCVILS